MCAWSQAGERGNCAGAGAAAAALPGRLALASLWLLLRLRRWKAAIKPLGEGSRPQILFQVHLFHSPVPGSELVPEQSKQI